MPAQYDDSMLGGSAPVQAVQPQQQTPPVQSNVQPVQQPTTQDTKPSYDDRSLFANHEQANSTNVPALSTVTPPQTDPMGMIRAAAKGWYHGMDIFATTIDKAIARGVGQKDVQTALQTSFDANTKQYNEDVDTKAHPLASGVGNFAGQATALAPLIALGTAGVPELFGGALAESGAPLVAQAVARAMGTVGINASSAALQGGLATNPGQNPNQIFNTDNARQAGMLGMALSPIQGLIGNKADEATNYEAFKNSLPKGTTVFSTDVPQNQGLWNSIKQGITNNVLSKIPYLSDIPGIGVNAARASQQQDIANGISNYVSGLAQKYPDGTMQTFSNAIKNSQQLANNTIATTSNTFRQILKATGTDSHMMTETGPMAADLKQVIPEGTFSKNFLPVLDQLQGKVPTSALLGTAQSSGIKQQVWAEAQRLGAMGRNNTAASDASNGLIDIYHSINNDIYSGLNHNQQAQEAFHTFNATTKAVSDLWNVKNSPEIAKAADSLNNNYKGMNTFYNQMVRGSIPQQQLDKYTGMMGQPGIDAIQAQQIQNIFNKNMQDNKLNIGGFFKDLNNTSPGSVNQTIRQPTRDALQGLQYLASKNQAAMGQGLDPATKVAAGGLAAGAGYLNAPATAATLATGTALGAMIAHPPLMNLLRTLNNFPGMKPGMSQYIMKKANDQLIKAGVILKTMNDGSISVEHQKDQTQ